FPWARSGCRRTTPSCRKARRLPAAIAKARQRPSSAYLTGYRTYEHLLSVQCAAWAPGKLGLRKEKSRPVPGSGPRPPPVPVSQGQSPDPVAAKVKPGDMVATRRAFILVLIFARFDRLLAKRARESGTPAGKGVLGGRLRHGTGLDLVFGKQAKRRFVRKCHNASRQKCGSVLTSGYGRCRLARARAQRQMGPGWIRSRGERWQALAPASPAGIGAAMVPRDCERLQIMVRAGKRKVWQSVVLSRSID